MNLFGGTFTSLESALNYSSAKNKIISNNIANIDTPNYKAKGISFKRTLENELNGSTIKANRTHKRHIPFSNESNTIHTYTKKNTSYNNNRNNVDIDQEMAELAKNQIYYQGIVDRINGKFRSLQTVIRGGNG